MLLGIEGFEGFGTSTGVAPIGLSRKYLDVNLPASMTLQNGRTGGIALRLANVNTYVHTYALTTNDTLIIGLGARFLSFSATKLISLYDGPTEGVNLRLKADGEFEVYRAGILLGTTSGAAIGIGNWGHIELKVKVHDTTGTVEFRINGVAKISLTGQDTKVGTNAYHDHVRFLGAWEIDDIYILDSTGTVNNDFLGNMKVLGILPTAEGDNIDFTPSTGTNNAAMVDENPTDDDTSFVEASGGGSKDLYQYGDVSGVGDLIAGVQINTDVKETDATTFDLVTVCKSGTTESDNVASPIGSTNYVTKTRIVELDPNTAAAWTAAGVNAAQFGIKIG